MTRTHLTLATALVLSLAACNQASEPANEVAATPTPVATAVPATFPTPTASATPTGAPIIAAGGYDTIRIGQPPAAATGYDLTDAGDIPGECRTFTTAKLPNAYVMVEKGQVRRITFFDRGGTGRYKTERGIGPGAGEAAIRRAYGTLGQEPHKYVEAPAKYLNWGEEGSPYGIRFEINAEGKAGSIHVGENPWLSYVEGCA